MKFADTERLKVAFEKAKKRYPKIQDLDITLRLSKSLFFTMRAFVKPSSFFTKKRKYIVCVNLAQKDILPKLSEEDLVGWFAHEIAHIIDYKTMSDPKLLRFYFLYLFSIRFRFSVEKRINAYVYNNGFAKELFCLWKKFLAMDGVNKRYKNYIIRNYAPHWEDIQKTAQKEGITEESYRSFMRT